MDEGLRDKVEAALRAAAGDSATVSLEETPDGKIGGLVLSDSFASLSPSGRQDLIWDQLDKRLNPYERTRVVFIVTDTREEYDAITAASA